MRVKSFLYLVQSRGALPAHYADLVAESSDVIYLTWGEKVEGAIYHPRTTWTEGRNRLLEEALRIQDKPLYYIFLDDDVVFDKGDWRTFEEDLIRYRPAIATPYFTDLTGWRYDPQDYTEAQTCMYFDAIFNAFHSDVVLDNIVLPYYTGLDEKSWTYSQWILIKMSTMLYDNHVLQLNRCHIGNTKHNSDYGNVDFGIPGKVLVRQVVKPKYILNKLFKRVASRLSWPDFTVKPAGMPRASYKLSSREKRGKLKMHSPFWADRRSSPRSSKEELRSI